MGKIMATLTKMRLLCKYGWLWGRKYLIFILMLILAFIIIYLSWPKTKRKQSAALSKLKFREGNQNRSGIPSPVSVAKLTIHTRPSTFTLNAVTKSKLQLRSKESATEWKEGITNEYLLTFTQIMKNRWRQKMSVIVVLWTNLKSYCRNSRGK